MAQQLTMDAAGRIVIPIGIRRRLMIQHGGVLSLTEDGARLVLEPVVQQPETRDQSGFMVFTSPLSGPLPDIGVVREEHLDRKLSSAGT